MCIFVFCFVFFTAGPKEKLRKGKHMVKPYRCIAKQWEEMDHVSSSYGNNYALICWHVFRRHGIGAGVTEMFFLFGFKSSQNDFCGTWLVWQTHLHKSRNLIISEKGEFHRKREQYFQVRSILKTIVGMGCFLHYIKTFASVWLI